MLITTFEAIAKRENLTLSETVLGECPWQRGLYPAPTSAHGNTTDPHACLVQKEDAYNRLIPTLKPDIVVLSNAIYENSTQRWVDAGGRPTNVTLRQEEVATRASIAAMRAPGRRFVILEPTPRGIIDPLACLAREKFVQQCRDIIPKNQTPIEPFYRALAARDHSIADINLDPLVCPFQPICDPIVNGVIVKWDPGHLTVAFAKSIAPAIDANLKARGLLPKQPAP